MIGVIKKKFCKLLYIFQVDSQPVIRRTKLYLQHQLKLYTSTIERGSSNVLTITYAAETVCFADDG